MEQRYIDAVTGQTIRPFSQSADVNCRDRSRRLELAMLDFGADHPFAIVVQKMKRHYGVDVASSTTRLDVQKHAATMQKSDYALSGKPASEAEVIIGETDGGMVPIVSQKDPNFTGDQRKNKIHEWREARLTLARPQGSVTPIYAAKIGTPDEIGSMLEATVNKAGRGKETKIHYVADGAIWISEQVENKFGADAYFLLDFYHASKYLAEASKCCCAGDSKQWLVRQQANLKTGSLSALFADLNAHTESCTLKNDCPALKCYNYLIKRTKQLDYKSAIEAELPIGSGEIESGIRSVIQRRLKLTGAWWKPENAQKMISLRTVVANNRFDAYGQDLRRGSFTSFA